MSSSAAPTVTARWGDSWSGSCSSWATSPSTSVTTPAGRPGGTRWSAGSSRATCSSPWSRRRTPTPMRAGSPPSTPPRQASASCASTSETMRFGVVTPWWPPHHACATTRTPTSWRSLGSASPWRSPPPSRRRGTRPERCRRVAGSAGWCSAELPRSSWSPSCWSPSWPCRWAPIATSTAAPIGRRRRRTPPPTPSPTATASDAPDAAAVQRVLAVIGAADSPGLQLSVVPGRRP